MVLWPLKLKEDRSLGLEAIMLIVAHYSCPRRSRQVLKANPFSSYIDIPKDT